VLSGLLGSTVGEFGVLRRRKKQSEQAVVVYQNGGVARISGCVYGLSPLSPNTWSGGELDVDSDGITWHPGNAGKGLGLRIDAAAFEPLGLRQVTSRESWAVTPGCLSLKGRFGRQTLEIAVLEDDIVLLLDSLRATRLLD
jgi:hypothetical protein